MEEVIIPEKRPRHVPAVVAEWCEPRLAQTFLRLANAVCPLTVESAHLKRIRPGGGGEGGGSLQLLLEAGPGVIERWSAQRSVASEASSLSNAVEKEFYGSWRSWSDATAHEVLSVMYAEFVASAAAEVECGGKTEEMRCECCDNAKRARKPALKLLLVSVPEYAPRQDAALWAESNKVWPLAMPKPSVAASALPPEAVRSAHDMMLHTVLPLAREAALSVAGGIGISAAVVHPETMEVLVTSEGFDGMRRDCLPACLSYGVRHQPCLAADAGDAALCGDSYRGEKVECPVAVLLDHPVTFVLKALSRLQRGRGRGLDSSERGASSGIPYLANSLDVYVSHEPCVMCAMALVHSRVGRVFFCYPNKSYGGLQSCYGIHAIPSLNHHFRSFCCYGAAQEFPFDGDALLRGEVL